MSPGPVSEEGGFRPDFQKEELGHGSEATEPAVNQLIWLPEVITWTVTTKLHNNKRHGPLLRKDLV